MIMIIIIIYLYDYCSCFFFKACTYFFLAFFSPFFSPGNAVPANSCVRNDELQPGTAEINARNIFASLRFPVPGGFGSCFNATFTI